MPSECSIISDASDVDKADLTTLLDKEGELHENDKEELRENDYWGDYKGTALINSDGLRLFSKHWVNDKEIAKEIAKFTPKGLVFIVHDYAEHCLRYTQLACSLIKHQLYPFAHDHVGHGQSQGKVVSVANFDIFARDVIHHITIVKEKFPDLPVYIIGHSMGGCIALRVCLKMPDLISKMVLIGAAVIPFRQVNNFFMRHLLRFLGNFFPQLPVLAKISENMLTWNEEQIALIKNDPLIYHGFMKAGFIKVFNDALCDLQRNLCRIHCPMLILHGQEDMIVPPEHSKILYERASSPNKTLKIYPELRHQLHAEKEPDGRTIRLEISQWLISDTN